MLILKRTLKAERSEDVPSLQMAERCDRSPRHRPAFFCDDSRAAFTKAASAFPRRPPGMEVRGRNPPGPAQAPRDRECASGEAALNIYVTRVCANVYYLEAFWAG